MTDIIEILVKSDKSITELDDDFYFHRMYCRITICL
ncbi:MAG: hypothetical protein CM15mP73_3760 [Hyphomicrobiales bacterium]|nr:MAG: hypothetical protein CM15mP73_3760 [Hyphomicrobiales bacterium]